MIDYQLAGVLHKFLQVVDGWWLYVADICEASDFQCHKVHKVIVVIETVHDIAAYIAVIELVFYLRQCATVSDALTAIQSVKGVLQHGHHHCKPAHIQYRTASSKVRYNTNNSIFV